MGGEPWVAWDPDFWKAEDVDSFLAGVFNYFDGFGDCALKVEPDWLCLNGAETDRFGHCFYLALGEGRAGFVDKFGDCWNR